MHNDRREEILQAAKELFAERGFRETNLNDVAVRLGFRRQALYHYFTSKDEILFELVERAGLAAESSVQQHLISDLAPIDKLREIVKVHVRQVLSDAAVFRVQIEELDKLKGERGESLRRMQAGYVHRIADVISAGQKDHTIMEMPPVALALFITGMCNSVVNWYAPASNLSIEQMADYAAEIAITGVRSTD